MLIEDVCRQARVLDPERDIERDGPDGVVALGDRDALKQVLLTLLDNAIKYGGQDVGDGERDAVDGAPVQPVRVELTVSITAIFFSISRPSSAVSETLILTRMPSSPATS